MFLPKNSQPVEVTCFPQKNHSSLSSKSPSSPPQQTIAPSSFNSRRSTLQLRLQIANDLILLAFLTCLERICSARQETKKSQRVTPIGTKLSRATNSFLPCNGITRCPTKSAVNSFLLACTKKHQRCGLSDTCNHCHMVAVTTKSRPKKRTSNPPETPCSRAAIQLLSRNPTQTTCCPREARNSA